MNPPTEIRIQAETPGDSASLFRFLIDDNVVGESLTAAEAHLLVGEILGRVALPGQGTISVDKLNASNDE